MWGWVFGKGLNIGMVGLAWWTLGCVALLGACVGRLVRDGDGHEILLEGEVRGEDGEIKVCK